MVSWKPPVAGNGDWGDDATAEVMTLGDRFRAQAEVVGTFFVSAIEPGDEVVAWVLDQSLFGGSVLLPAKEFSDTAIFECAKNVFYSLTVDVASTCGKPGDDAERLADERTARAMLRGAVEMFESAMESTVPETKHCHMRLMAQIEMTRRFLACPPTSTRTALLACAMALVDFTLLRFAMVHARAEMRIQQKGGA